MTARPPITGPDALDAWRDRWPNAAASRLVEAAGLTWHVQRAGPRTGPTVLLVHGTAGATHAWHALLPPLAARCDVIAVDLPGHAFTGAPPDHRLTLSGMAEDLDALLRALEAQPDVVVGHSAGAAILYRMALDGAFPRARLLVGYNAAIVPPAPAYRALAVGPLQRLFTSDALAGWIARWAAGGGLTEGMLRSTGSRLPPDVLACYEALTASPTHVHTALTMMAQWDLRALLLDSATLRLPSLLLAGAEDRWVVPADAARVAEHIPGARFRVVPGLGHLMHEEAGDQLAEELLQAIDELRLGDRARVAVHARGHGARPHP